MLHCPDCHREFPPAYDVCPDCWERLAQGKPRGRLQLVYTTNALYDAEMIETLLQNEGIHCLKVKAPGAGLLSLNVPSPLSLTRLYVHRGMAQAALEIITEVTGSAVSDA